MNSRQHKTKIVCTLGPSTSTPEILDTLMSVPIDVARFNFSHGNRDSKRRRSPQHCASEVQPGLWP
ncbi:MAG: pyruvate kinase [Desulfobulbales bacterium]